MKSLVAGDKNAALKAALQFIQNAPSSIVECEIQRVVLKHQMEAIERRVKPELNRDLTLRYLRLLKRRALAREAKQ